MCVLLFKGIINALDCRDCGVAYPLPIFFVNFIGYVSKRKLLKKLLIV